MLQNVRELYEWEQHFRHFLHVWKYFLLYETQRQHNILWLLQRKGGVQQKEERKKKMKCGGSLQTDRQTGWNLLLPTNTLKEPNQEKDDVKLCSYSKQGDGRQRKKRREDVATARSIKSNVNRRKERSKTENLWRGKVGGKAVSPLGN